MGRVPREKSDLRPSRRPSGGTPARADAACPPRQVMEACDALVEIPTFGIKAPARRLALCAGRGGVQQAARADHPCALQNSLNVASAAPVVIFEVLRKWGHL